MGDEERNFVHEAENWRQRVKGEVDTARVFDEQFGFMTQKPSLNARAHQQSLVKYFNSHSPSWTVEAKRVPLPYGTKGSEAAENQATLRALGTHSTRMESVRDVNSQFRQTSKCYGLRQSLETFGVSQYGIKQHLGDSF